MQTDTAGGLSPVNQKREEFVSLDKVRVTLAKLWFAGALSIALILIVQSLLGKYETDVQEVWGWVLPTLMPSLGMILAVLSYTALDQTLRAAAVRRSFYEISRWLSLVYLLIVLLTILIQPFASNRPVELMRMSNLWLGPLQGLIGSALGVLFVSKKKT